MTSVLAWALFRILRLFVTRAFNMRFNRASYVHSIPRAGTVLDGRPLEFTHPATLLHTYMCVVHVCAHMCVGYMCEVRSCHQLSSLSLPRQGLSLGHSFSWSASQPVSGISCLCLLVFGISGGLAHIYMGAGIQTWVLRPVQQNIVPSSNLAVFLV